MMRSLYSAVSGLQVHQRRMDVIGNNISNVNTVGFKASRMTFATAISQRMASASADDPERGRAGRNPMQVGLGVNIGSIDSLMNQGAASRTDRALDLTIQGEGFFVVSDYRGTYFTRQGNIDWNGHTFAIGGRQLMGWNAVEDPNRPGQFVIEQGAVQPLVTLPEHRFMDPRATSFIEATGNLNVEDLIDNRMVRPVQFYDSLGNSYTVDVAFRWHPPVNHPNAETGAGAVHSTNEWSWWTMYFLPGTEGEELDSSINVTMFPNGDRSRGITAELRKAWTSEAQAPPYDQPDEFGRGMRIGFRPDTGRVGFFNLVGVDQPGTPNGSGRIPAAEFNLHFSVPALSPPSVVGGGDPEVDQPPTFNTGYMTLNFTHLRQHGQERTSIRILSADGNPPGSLADISIGGDGIIMARYTNGEMRPIGQVPLAFFDNPEGLERLGDNLWITSANSGVFDGVGGHGELIPGTLEMSNVELSYEFTEMITTQRGFQANSRVISTSDEMLQELVNLKR
jgi:flagellar hook protein FlgE